MNIWVVNCVAAFLLSVFFAGIVIPQILLIAFRKQLFDTIDERKIHTSVVPRLGGIAFKPVIMFSLVVLYGVNVVLGHHELGDQIAQNGVTVAFTYCSVMLLFLSGMADDLVGIRYSAKFVIQILCGVMMIAGGLWVSNFHGALFIGEVPAWIGYPFTVLLAVFIINAFNLIDGIDGLASGLSSMACLFFGIVYFTLGEYLYAMLAFATLGVLVQFFYYNVFGNPEKQKKIFMGDTGSLTIGMIICILSVKMASMSGEATQWVNPMVLAFSPLLVPCCDVVRVYFHRVRHGKNPFLPDKNHIHHKLLAIGLPQRVAMITIVTVSLLFTVVNVWLSKYLDVTLIFVIDLAVWTLGNIWLSKQIAKRNSDK